MGSSEHKLVCLSFHSSRKYNLPQGTPTSLKMPSKECSCNTRVKVVAVEPRKSCRVPNRVISCSVLYKHIVSNSILVLVQNPLHLDFSIVSIIRVLISNDICIIISTPLVS